MDKANELRRRAIVIGRADVRADRQPRPGIMGTGCDAEAGSSTSLAYDPAPRGIVNMRISRLASAYLCSPVLERKNLYGHTDWVDTGASALSYVDRIPPNTTS